MRWPPSAPGLTPWCCPALPIELTLRIISEDEAAIDMKRLQTASCGKGVPDRSWQVALVPATVKAVLNSDSDALPVCESAMRLLDRDMSAELRPSSIRSVHGLTDDLCVPSS